MRCSSASACASPDRLRNSSTSFSRRSISLWRSISIWPPLSFERLGGGAPAFVFSFALIRAPFERRGCHRFRGRAAGPAARENHAGISGSSPRNLWQPRRSNGARMSAKEKTKAGAPPPNRSKESGGQIEIERQREIERLEKDVEELRHLSGAANADAELQPIRGQVAELRREFYAHLGPWN